MSLRRSPRLSAVPCVVVSNPKSPAVSAVKKKSVALPAEVADNSQSHYDYCTVCSRSGELLLCDTCPQVYHLECANLLDIPGGTWNCPKCVHLKKPKVVAPVKM